MKRSAIFFVLAALALAPLAAGQDGKILYEQLCSACHGSDGRGDREGQHPPLADSAWIKGAPDRLIQIVLHGLMGEITVPSKHSVSPTYDLVMPPQSALSNEQIAKITNYVRNSWGNMESTISIAIVEAQRKVTSGRKEFWLAKEILKRYPLNGKAGIESSNLQNLKPK